MSFWLHLFGPLLTGSSVLVVGAVAYAVFLTALDEIAERATQEPPR